MAALSIEEVVLFGVCCSPSEMDERNECITLDRLFLGILSRRLHLLISVNPLADPFSSSSSCSGWQRAGHRYWLLSQQEE